MIDCSKRFRYSAITSFAMALVAFWLYYSFPQYVNPTVSLLSGLVFLIDAYAKYVDDRSLRRVTTILFSFANAFLIFAGFKYVGDPFSDLVAFLWIIDGVLKLPGINTEWEGRFRHLFSAFMTMVAGLSLIFTYHVFGLGLLSLFLGIMVLGDAYVKFVYVRDRCFVVS